MDYFYYKMAVCVCVFLLAYPENNRLTGLAIMMMNSLCVQAVSICYVCGGRWQAHWAVHLLSSLNWEQLCALI